MIHPDPCCCGQTHGVDSHGMMLPEHHETSRPKGFCEYCNCNECKKIISEYLQNIG